MTASEEMAHSMCQDICLMDIEIHLLRSFFSFAILLPHCLLWITLTLTLTITPNPNPNPNPKPLTLTPNP